MERHSLSEAIGRQRSVEDLILCLSLLRETRRLGERCAGSLALILLPGWTLKMMVFGCLCLILSRLGSRLLTYL